MKYTISRRSYYGKHLLSPNGGILQGNPPFFDTADEFTHIDPPGIYQTSAEVSILVMKRLGREEVGYQTLNIQLEIFIGLISF